MKPIQYPGKGNNTSVRTQFDPQRLELLHQLWKIKQGLERINEQSIQLSQLRKDAIYLKKDS